MPEAPEGIPDCPPWKAGRPETDYRRALFDPHARRLTPLLEARAPRIRGCALTYMLSTPLDGEHKPMVPLAALTATWFHTKTMAVTPDGVWCAGGALDVELTAVAYVFSYVLLNADLKSGHFQAACTAMGGGVPAAALGAAGDSHRWDVRSGLPRRPVWWGGAGVHAPSPAGHGWDCAGGLRGGGRNAGAAVRAVHPLPTAVGAAPR